MLSTRNRTVRKSVYLAACLFVSSLASASVFAEPDVIRVQAQNEAYFDITRLELINKATNKSASNGARYRGRDGSKKNVRMKVPETGLVTQSYEFFVDPYGGRSAETCVKFDVTSDNGQITHVTITGPFGPGWGLDLDDVDDSRKWLSKKSNPQLATLFVKVRGDLRKWRCTVEYVRRHSK